MNQAIVALGSNLNAPHTQVSAAIIALARIFPQGFDNSPIFRTPAVEMTEEAYDFANAVVVFDTSLPPLGLLRNLQAIEIEFGRPQVHGKNTARTLDLDLISCGDVVCRTDELILPHPRAFTRRFVLEPLITLLPDFRFPNSDLSLETLISRAPPLDMALWSDSDD